MGGTPGSNVAPNTQRHLFGVIPKLSGRRERMDFRTGSREARKWDGTLETRGRLKSAERGKEVRTEKLLVSLAARLFIPLNFSQLPYGPGKSRHSRIWENAFNNSF